MSKDTKPALPEPLAEAIRSLQAELARINERLAVLESATARPATARPATVPAPAPAPAPAPVPAPAPAPGISDELVTIIGAAIAAYLGKKAHVRQIRLLGSAAWAQQGRVTVQASHRLEIDR
jgi:methylmalonyl-CoA carboxyltransferase large subunit